MKNPIPIIIAVVLSAAAVFAVKKIYDDARRQNGEKDRHYEAVVFTAKDIPANAEIQESWLVKREIDVESLPRKFIPWGRANLVVGQKTNRSIPSGDYVLLSDIVQLGTDIDSLIHNGEWAVPVTFADASLVQFLEPGMEIAILGTFDMKDVVESVDGTEKPKTVSEEATSVIFPCVKILDIGTGDGIRHEKNGRGGKGTIIVALTPQQATTLVAAQRTMDLYPALRRREDTSSLKRRDVGVVNDSTFQNLKKGLDPVVIPDKGN